MYIISEGFELTRRRIPLCLCLSLSLSRSLSLPPLSLSLSPSLVLCLYSHPLLTGKASISQSRWEDARTVTQRGPSEQGRRAVRASTACCLPLMKRRGGRFRLSCSGRLYSALHVRTLALSLPPSTRRLTCARSRSVSLPLLGASRLLPPTCDRK